MWYKSTSEKAKEGLALTYDNKARVNQEIQEVKKIIERNEQLIEEYTKKGRRDLAKKYAVQAAKANSRLENLKEESSFLDDLAVNLRVASRELDPERQRDYKKMNKVVKKVIKAKGKKAPLRNSEKNSLEECLGELNRMYERENSVQEEMGESHYVPSPEVEKKAEEYMKKVDARIKNSEKTVSDLEKKIKKERERTS